MKVAADPALPNTPLSVFPSFSSCLTLAVVPIDGSAKAVPDPVYANDDASLPDNLKCESIGAIIYMQLQRDFSRFLL